MGRLRNRIHSASDSYYVSGEGYRDARRRMHTNKFNVKMNVLTLTIGVIIILGGFQLEISKMIYLGIGLFLFGCLTTWLTYRNRKYE